MSQPLAVEERAEAGKVPVRWCAESCEEPEHRAGLLLRRALATIEALEAEVEALRAQRDEAPEASSVGAEPVTRDLILRPGKACRRRLDRALAAFSEVHKVDEMAIGTATVVRVRTPSASTMLALLLAVNPARVERPPQAHVG